MRQQDACISVSVSVSPLPPHLFEASKSISQFTFQNCFFSLYEHGAILVSKMRQGKYNMCYISYKMNQIFSLKENTKEMTAVLQRIFCFGLVIAHQLGLWNNDSTTIFIRNEHGVFVKVSPRKGGSLVKVCLHNSLSSSLLIVRCLLNCDVNVFISFPGDLNDIAQTLVLRVVQGHNCYPMTWGSISALCIMGSCSKFPAIPWGVSRREGGCGSGGIKSSKATNLAVLLSFSKFLLVYLLIH